MDSGNEGGIEKGDGRNSETGNGIDEGIAENGDLAEKRNGKPLSDESLQPTDNIHGNQVDMDEGEPPGIPFGTISGKGIG